MKAVILAGGLGTRLSEETQAKPKPMVEIGGRPIIWHIMKIFSSFQINEFVICLGYKGYMVKEFLANYFLHTSDVTIDLKENSVKVHRKHSEPWKVTLVDTGESTMTGGRLKRVAEYLDDEFYFTYGDGVTNQDLTELLKFHRSQKTLATVTAVQPPGRFGAIRVESDRVIEFAEKPIGDAGWINGGYFILNKRVLDYIDGDQTIWEREPLERLASEKQLAAFFHRGFWQPMDTLRDKNYLERVWESGSAPWKRWA